MIVRPGKLAGLVDRGVDAGEGGQLRGGRKAAYVADFAENRRAQHQADTRNGRDAGIKTREQFGDFSIKSGDYQEQADCRSRNEFVAAALESYIAGLQGNAMEDALVKKLAGAIEKAVDYEAVKISKGLFRYAVELNVIMQMMAQAMEFTPDELQEFRREAVNNVRRTRGKVRLDDLFHRRDEDSL